MIPFAFHTVTRQRAAIVADAGNAKKRDWNNSTDIEVSGCNVQPLTATEIHDAGLDQGTDYQRLHAPPSSDIKMLDRVVFDGVTYEVHGVPQKHVNPLSMEWNHLYVLLRRITG